MSVKVLVDTLLAFYLCFILINKNLEYNKLHIHTLLSKGFRPADELSKQILFDVILKIAKRLPTSEYNHLLEASLS